MPAGPFTMGSDPAAEHAPDPDEAPQHSVAVPAFRLGRTPVTNAEYRAFVVEAGRPSPSSWPGGAIPLGREHHPVTYVSWDDAAAFCAWAGGRLPTEAEWERAARGADARTWPWGDELPDVSRALFRAVDTCAVGLHPLGAGPFAALDLAGNVWEWTASALRPYPYEPADGRESPGADEPRAVRGGTFAHGPRELRCSYRHGFVPGARDHYVVIRLAAGLTARVRPGLDLVDVPAGEVRLGEGLRRSAGPALPDEAPRHEVVLASFALARAPVTNAQYAAFVAASGWAAPSHWPGGAPPAGLETHPVTHVDWHDARAFCAWAGGRLPSEAEWEKAARGADGRLYPWGDAEPDGRLAAFGAGVKGTPVSAGSLPAGASPYGLLDMAGNVWEWVSSAYRPYPYDHADGREDAAGDEQRVLRGGSYASPGPLLLRCAARSRSWPGRRAPHIGFRVARDAA